MLRWATKLVLRYRYSVALVLAVQMTCSVLVALQPYYYQEIVRLVVSNRTNAFLSEGLSILGLLATIYLFVTLMQGLGGWVACRFSSNLLRKLQIAFFEQITRLPLQNIQHQAAGEFFTRFNSDVGQTQKFVADTTPAILREILTVIIVAGILFYFCPALLTIAALMIAGATAFLLVLLQRKLLQYADAQRSGWGEINRLFDETVQGIDTLKTFSTDGHRKVRFQRQTGKFRNLVVRAGTIASVFGPGIELVAKLGGLALILLAYTMIARGEIRLEPFLLFFFYAGLLQAATSSLAGLLSGAPSELIGLRNLADFFAAEVEEDDWSVNGLRIEKSEPIDFAGLTFSYKGNRQLYKNAALHVPAHATTVIHGPSGSGKSTLIQLLLRFRVPDQGSITTGGIDIARFSRTELRRKIGVVTQDHYIFHETLRQNLLVAKPDATDDQIVEALHQALLSEFLDRLPAGLDTMLDPRGKGLSAGEKQRICIARMLLKKAPVMILDEPWSNLDGEARRKLVRLLNTVRYQTTLLILSHETPEAIDIDQHRCLNPDTGKFFSIAPEVRCAI